MLNVYIPSVEFLKIKKCIHMEFHFVALILNKFKRNRKQTHGLREKCVLS